MSGPGDTGDTGDTGDPGATGDARLQALVPGRIWSVQAPLRFGPLRITTRMTVLRRDDGQLWVHSPLAPDPALVAALALLGPVGDVVAPNCSHHLYFAAFMAAHPGARGHLAPGLRRKRPDLAAWADLPAGTGRAGDLRFGADVPGWFLPGMPSLNETAWFDRASGTLILTDLLFCFQAPPRALERVAARLLGVHRRLAMTPTMKRLVRDRGQLAGVVAWLLELPVERVVVAHDAVVTDRAAERLRDALAWIA